MLKAPAGSEGIHEANKLAYQFRRLPLNSTLLLSLGLPYFLALVPLRDSMADLMVTLFASMLG